MSNDLTKELLAMPTAPPAPRQRPETDYTRQIEVSKGTVSAEIRDQAGLVNEGTGLKFLEEEGLNPAEWEATGFRKIKYGQGMESVRFTYKRIGYLGEDRPPLDELIGLVKKAKPQALREDGDHAYVVALGDTQFGKIDGDGVDGTLARTVAYLNNARDLLELHRKRFDVGHVHIAWLGDHIEGFASQGGANVWRTPLTLNEQIRLVRRVMFHALDLFGTSAERVSMAAVPGNHGEPQRFSGKGVTRYDDSHDTESLIAVSDAAKLNQQAFGHVEFYVPETDEMTVVLDLAGTTTGHAHGHQFRPGRHFQWWEGQSFGGSPLGDAHLLLTGHLHHEFVESNGKRLFAQVPALESESTWYRHSKGVPGNPGILTLITKAGKVGPIEVVR